MAKLEEALQELERRKMRVKLSKMMTRILRHEPSGIVDEEGWADIDELVKLMRRRFNLEWLRREHVLAVAYTDEKGRYEVKGNKIRARYGHSFKVKIELEEANPSERILYHGTSKNSLPSILKEGIKPMKRVYVHLTTSLDEALENARRKGRPVILVIDRNCLEQRGIKVYKAGKHVRVTTYVPPECIKEVKEV